MGQERLEFVGEVHSAVDAKRLDHMTDDQESRPIDSDIIDYGHIVSVGLLK
jgi:hypothetical protein